MKNNRGLMSISDFAAYCGSTRQTMQYYDRIGLLDPIYVEAQGYRYYQPLQGHEFRLIQCLQRSGCSLKEVESILNSTDIGVLQAKLEEKQQVLEQELLRIRREQLYLQRFAQFLSWAGKHPLEQPTLIRLHYPVQLNALPFSEPCEPYSEHYYRMILNYADFYRNNNAVQVYPYFLYVGRNELRDERRFCKLLCLVDEPVPQKEAFTAPAVDYLCIHSHPEKKEDIRRICYEQMFRFMDEHGLEPLGGAAEMPFCIPPGLRKDEYRFTVVFLMPVIPAGGVSGGGETA